MNCVSQDFSREMEPGGNILGGGACKITTLVTWCMERVQQSYQNCKANSNSNLYLKIRGSQTTPYHPLHRFL